MAPTNFEKNIKDKLEKRSLKPSKDAWNKLAERLDEQEGKSNKKPYWWLGLAASIVGILFIVSQFLNNEIKIDDTPEIVDTPEVEVIKNNSENTIAIEKKVIDVQEDNHPEPQKQNTRQGHIKKSGENPKKQEYVVVQNENEKESKSENSEIVDSVELPKRKLTFEEQKVEDVIAQVQNMKDANQVVTDADIAALLEAAEKEIKLNRLYNETTGVVDANALLQDVEAEIDQSSFRAKVFEALKSSYNSVKTAVAQRNN